MLKGSVVLDLFFQHPQGVFQLNDPGLYGAPMCLQHGAPRGGCLIALRTEPSELRHLAHGHASDPQAIQEFDPGLILDRVPPMTVDRSGDGLD